MSGRIIDKLDLIDTKGFAWEAWITVPWDRPGEEHQSHGPAEPQVEFITPNDPDHPFYGEDGPTFNVADLRAIVVSAVTHGEIGDEP